MERKYRHVSAYSPEVLSLIRQMMAICEGRKFPEIDLALNAMMEFLEDSAITFEGRAQPPVRAPAADRSRSDA